MVGARLSVHGLAGAEALVPLLADPSEDVRRLAAIALGQFDTLDPRHVPALIAAHRRGLDVANAIARTGSEEALRYLEGAWAIADEGNAARWALPLLGRRAEPFLMRELERCRQACSPREAGALIYALDRIGPLPDPVLAVIRDVAVSVAADPELRRAMEDQLIFRHDPAALPIVIRRLTELRGDAYEDWQAAQLLQWIESQGEAARASAGPLILAYLSRPELRRARIAAVVTSLVIDYQPAIPALRALLAESDRDWHLAYDTVWALAELQANQARPEIEELARGHWYLPVRNSARRALNRLDGGKFELPELGDEQRGSYAGNLNFAADVDPVRDCGFEAAAALRRFGRETPVPAGRPLRGTIRVALDQPPEGALAALGEAPELPQGGRVTLDWRRDGERLVGIDGGRFEGGLFAIDGTGRVRRILAENVFSAFEMPNAVLVVTGDTLHEEADVWLLRTGGVPAVAQGPLRLPASPTGYALASDGTLLIRTDRGDVAVARDGRLLRPRPCSNDAARQ